ncbi:hypothetical protein [Methanosphaera sp. BMS]|uniref:hypothetical protein n=1 Tax=Methanosphaera sp. BMS TaxID=1789762 RepID=UPI000DC1C0CE|nr:hypothetical protein [Methanosphaera sp. BMS]AWX31993.1 hypothetical protein AW729_02280 [Methanosphaera sp. BMS]
MIDDWQILLIRTCYIIEVSTTFSTTPIVRQLRLEDATMKLNRLKEIDKNRITKTKKMLKRREKNIYQLTTHLRLTNLPRTNKIINTVSNRYNK